MKIEEQQIACHSVKSASGRGAENAPHLMASIYCTAVLSEAWAKLRAKLLILPRNIHTSLREIGEWENNFD